MTEGRNDEDIFETSQLIAHRHKKYEFSPSWLNFALLTVFEVICRDTEPFWCYERTKG